MVRGANGGPKSAEGKKRVSRNAYRHGILSSVAALKPMEDPRDWEYHRDGIFESLEPVGYLESVLAENIAWALWNKRRVAYFQQVAARRSINGAEERLKVAAAYKAGTLSKGEYPDVPQVEIDLAQAARTLPFDQMNLIMRYEAHLHRQYIQTLHELESMQARRRGESAPLARLDISVPPSGG